MHFHILEHVKSRIIRNIVAPFSRAYSRQSMSGDEPPGRIVRFLTALSFWLIHGYKPDLKSPRTFSEKLFHRMLFDRNPIWTIITDKLLVRRYVTERTGDNLLIPLLWTGKDPDDIPFADLPAKFFIKTNHGCGYNIPVIDKSRASTERIRSQLKKWLKENYCTDKNLGLEWAYKNIEPKIMVESFIAQNDVLPTDYKIYCYSGKAEFLLVVKDRFENMQKSFFTRDLRPLNIKRGKNQHIEEIEFPDNYEEMVQFAQALSREFDFIRVDLYNVEGRIYFGELTCYPTGGLASFTPREYDFIFGEKWHIQK